MSLLAGIDPRLAAGKLSRPRCDRLLLALRRRKAERSSVAERSMWRAWAKAWGSPAAYKGTMALGRAVARQRVFGPLVRRLPGAQQWVLGRDLPPVRGRTFMEMWERGDV